MCLWRLITHGTRCPQRRGEHGTQRVKPARDYAVVKRSWRVMDKHNSGLGLLEAALARENLVRAWKRVRANRGSAGADGLSIAQTGEMLRDEWPWIRASILSGEYRPQPVRRVEIAKRGGGVRVLGIPSVTDRLIQQALLQVLQPLIDPTFSESSFGFRPGRRAHDAIVQAQAYVQSGYRVVVDVDLETFFDHVNHDVLMERLARRVADRGVLRLIRHYLKAGMFAQGLVTQRHEGTPQGGPLSPLLANVLLDDVDKALERDGHRFVRYADDCNVYVRSQRAGERVMRRLRALYATLRLKVNEAKSAVANVSGRSFLGFSFWTGPQGEIRRRVARSALQAFRHRIRELTRRLWGRSLAEVAGKLRVYMLGWKGYFGLAQTPSVFRSLDEWLRHRLRALWLKQCKRGHTVRRVLRARGVPESVIETVARNVGRWWHNSAMLLNLALPVSFFDELGVPRLS